MHYISRRQLREELISELLEGNFSQVTLRLYPSEYKQITKKYGDFIRLTLKKDLANKESLFIVKRK